MVEADRIDRVEPPQIVLVGRVVAVPGDHVERRMVQSRRPQPALEFLDQLGGAIDVLEGGHGRQEVARIGQAVGADRPQLRQAQQGAVVLADIAARRPIHQVDPEAHAAGDDRDLQRRHLKDPHLGDQPKPPFLGDHQQLPVGVEEHLAGHRAVGEVEVRGQSRALARPAGACQGDQAFDEVLRRIRRGGRVPAQAVGGRLGLIEGPAADQAGVDPLERRMIGRGADAVEPAAPVVGPGGGEGRARQPLRIEAERRPLRRVLTHRQGAWRRLGGELVAEAAEIGGLPHAGVGVRDHAVGHRALPSRSLGFHYGPAARRRATG